MKRDLKYILTTEMTQDEWERFRFEWMEDFAKELRKELSLEDDESLHLALVHFETFCAEGWRERNKKILTNREHDRVS